MARRLLVSVDHEAARERARLDARAAITARLEGLPECGALLTEACWWSTAATADELLQVALTSTRLAAACLGCEPATLLAALLVARTAAAYEPTGPPP